MNDPRFLILAALMSASAYGIELFPRLDPDETTLARLNCSTADAPEWKPVAHWTAPGYWPKSTSLRAYHAASLGSGVMNVDYMVCHIGWYPSAEDSSAAFAMEHRKDSSFVNLGIGERMRFTSHMDPPTVRTPQAHYDILLLRGPFLFRAGISSVRPWTPSALAAFTRRIDAGLAAQAAALESHPSSGRLLKDKLKDPSRAPACLHQCNVHSIPLLPETVPMAYGYAVQPHWTPARAEIESRYFEAKAQFFPFAKVASVAGGCIVDELRDFTWVCSCVVCNAEEAKWNAAHQRTQR